MANEKTEPLTITECETVVEALWELVKQYPKQKDDPEVKAEYDALGANKSLSVSVLGGRYKKKYVSGSFTAEVAFHVAYKSQPQTSEQRIDRQAFVGRIMQWLENTKNLPLLTDGRTITRIATQGVPYKDETGQNKDTVYAADAVMEYMKKGV